MTDTNKNEESTTPSWFKRPIYTPEDKAEIDKMAGEFVQGLNSQPEDQPQE